MTAVAFDSIIVGVFAFWVIAITSAVVSTVFRQARGSRHDKLPGASIVCFITAGVRHCAYRKSTRIPHSHEMRTQLGHVILEFRQGGELLWGDGMLACFRSSVYSLLVGSTARCRCCPHVSFLKHTNVATTSLTTPPDLLSTDTHTAACSIRTAPNPVLAYRVIE